MIKYLLILLILSVGAHAAGNAELLWTPPTKNVDGSVLTDLAGYVVYWSSVSSDLYVSHILDDPSIVQYLVVDLTNGDWRFAVTAYDTSGNEGPFSGFAFKTIVDQPVVLTITVFTVVKQENRFILLAVGTAPADTQCDMSQSLNGMNVVPISVVTWTGTVRPVVVVADCL